MAVATFAGVALLIIAVDARVQKPVSEYFDICRRDDTNLGQCINNTLFKARNNLANGIPELDLVPLDPLFIPLLDMKQSGFGLDFKLINVTILGLKDFRILGCEASLQKRFLNISMKTPFIRFEGDYSMDGRILAFPIKGAGKTSLNFTNVLTDSYTELQIYQKKGQDYVRAGKVEWLIEPEHAQSQFTNLFAGDPTLSASINQFLNDNWKEAFEAFRELPQQAFSQLFKALINRVLKHHTYKEWFPV